MTTFSCWSLSLWSELPVGEEWIHPTGSFLTASADHGTPRPADWAVRFRPGSSSIGRAGRLEAAGDSEVAIGESAGSIAESAGMDDGAGHVELSRRSPSGNRHQPTSEPGRATAPAGHFSAGD